MASNTTPDMTHRERVNTALAHRTPDRLPTDFLATPEIWEKLLEHFGIRSSEPGDDLLFDPAWEEVLRRFGIDCRVVSYDQFVSLPESLFWPGDKVEWWKVKGRSTPARMWRRAGTDGLAYDVFGRCFREEKTRTGSYEINVNVLDSAQAVEDLKSHPWPDPSWWDFSSLKQATAELNRREEHHIRFRSGSVFEVAWQLRGMDKFMMDLSLDPAIPEYIMDRITEVLVDNIDAALTEVPEAVDMVYFYDDVASKDALLISREMWSSFIKPRHQRIIDVIKKHGKKVMYHTDGSVFDLLPELIDMGIDVLNPIQPDARNMAPKKLKDAYGDRLSFHGGIDIIETLPRGTVEDVKNEVAEKAGVLGQNGGYILASSHHIQSDTPLENILAMYGLE